MAHNLTSDETGELLARIDELETADRAKDQFLALLSRELRNHIHAIRTNAWLIQARVKDTELARPTDAIDRRVVCDRARSKQAGFAYHLTKPVDFDVLASLLATAARRTHH